LTGSKLLDSPKVQLALRKLSGGRVARTADGRRRVIDSMTPAELEEHVIAPTGLQLVQPLDTAISRESFDNLQHWKGAGELTPAQGTPFPHITLKAHGSPWTSAFLAFHKPA